MISAAWREGSLSFSEGMSEKVFVAPAEYIKKHTCYVVIGINHVKEIRV